MSLNPDVSLKLTLATATILTGCALRVTRVVTRENGESLLAVVFGILLPSLLIQVRDEFGHTETLSPGARSGGTRSYALVVLFLLLLLRRLVSLCVPFFFSYVVFIGRTKEFAR